MNIIVGAKYTNKKTHHYYVVLDIALAAWDSSETLVVYREVGRDYPTVWVRSKTEFLEKFEEAR